MRKLIVILSMFFLLVLTTSCGEKVSNGNSNQQAGSTQYNDENSTATQQTDAGSTNKSIELLLDKKIETSSYSVSIPKSWSYEEVNSDILNLKKDNVQIGGIYIQPYYKDVEEPVSSLLPNHTEIIDSKKLTGFFTETQEMHVVSTEPAVSGDSNSENWIYVFFVKDKEVVYEIFFNTKFIDESNILNIAKSFKLSSGT
ncbi:hypothetical protein LY28_00982 [Ruminiclostridium sufflavum DSM 19573]|uniref:Lipoprotein n=1 Tax=Ruminiclostridium sufflavum DSM 19573 TaxID=1121337 RepID=A0A318Y1D8_9FIRM|nr:hypothetical protein [Ruminiclostridium sufflavum]PYG89159.1 hypothetical protein LY28_00982 [Ruminiclostridium sufflavum DSM 19573]